MYINKVRCFWLIVFNIKDLSIDLLTNKTKTCKLADANSKFGWKIMRTSSFTAYMIFKTQNKENLNTKYILILKNYPKTHIMWFG